MAKVGRGAPDCVHGWRTGQEEPFVLVLESVHGVDMQVSDSLGLNYSEHALPTASLLLTPLRGSNTGQLIRVMRQFVHF